MILSNKCTCCFPCGGTTKGCPSERKFIDTPVLDKLKEERRKFLFWFHGQVTKGSLPLTEKETAWAGWCASKGYLP